MSKKHACFLITDDLHAFEYLCERQGVRKKIKMYVLLAILDMQKKKKKVIARAF